MSPSAGSVLFAIRKSATEVKGRQVSRLDNDAIRQLCGYSTRQCVRALRQLEESGLISVERDDQHPVLHPTGRTIVLVELEEDVEELAS